jgi:pantoate--beta-alanine ligase
VLPYPRIAEELRLETLRTIAEVRDAQKRLTGSFGVVPTMGALHEGHLTLVRSARAENDHVFVSIFVNPTQFGPNEDFAAYPRDVDRDLALLETEGVDYVFLPGVEEMYPPHGETFVEVGQVANRLEGEHRPGHFRGVATVVLKLFNILKPTRAYFGRKDAQQLVVIRRMVRDLHLDIEVVPVDTVREPDGLALSSRNAYLNPSERQAALCLSSALNLAREMWTRGTRDADYIRRRMLDVLAEEELAKPDYVSIAHPETLEELERIHGRVLVSMAVRIGKTRLIDNITLGE